MGLPLRYVVFGDLRTRYYFFFQIAARLKYDSNSVRADKENKIGADIDGDIGFVDIRGRDQSSEKSNTTPTTTLTITITKSMVRTMYAMLLSSYLYITYSLSFR